MPINLKDLKLSKAVRELNPELQAAKGKGKGKRKGQQPQKAELTKQADAAPILVAWLEILAKDLPKPQTEYRFHATRLWRFDLAWPELRLAVEVDGGRHLKHGQGHYGDADLEKRNEASILDWHLLQISTQMLDKDPKKCVDFVRRALAKQQQKLAKKRLRLTYKKRK